MVMSRDDIMNDIRRQTGRPALSQAPLIPQVGGVGAPQVGGGSGAPTGSPAPPAPKANGDTPASVGPGNGGAGTTTPMDMLTKADPENVVKSAETAVRTTAKSGATDDPKADAQKKQINEAMAAQGMDPEAGFNELKEQYLTALDERHKAGEIDKKQHTALKDRWKNIFNVVPKEDFGLFMMDFGLRLAAHSAENNFAGAFGQAGLGALQGAEQRQLRRQGESAAREQQAHERAMDMSKLGLEERKASALAGYYERGSAPQTTATESGLVYWNPKTQDWDYVRDPQTGGVLKQEYAGNRPYQGEKAWLDAQLRDTGVDSDERMSLILGARTPQERSQILQETLLELMGDVTAKDSNGKRYRDYTEQDMTQWIAKSMAAADKAVNVYREQRALEKYR